MGAKVPTSNKEVKPGPAASRFKLRKNAMGGLIEHRRGWSLSLRGVLFCFALVLAAGTAALRLLYPFLALTDRVATNVLVVDGGMPMQMFRLVAEEYAQHHYHSVFVVRGLYSPGSLSPEQNDDDYVAEILARHGVPRDRIHSIIFDGFQRDRSIYSALALRDWSRKNAFDVTSFNLVTSGSKARRTALLYRRVWGKEAQIGVVGLDDPAFDARHWWRSSEGVRDVFFEGIAYLYILLFSWPVD